MELKINIMKELNQNNIQGKYQLPIKAIQFGEGNFLRAFVDWILDNLNDQNKFNGSIAIVQPIENGMSDLINKQDGLYHVITNGLVNNEMKEDIRLVKSLSRCINPFKEFQKFLNLAREENLKIIVSNTTEAGIQFKNENFPNNSVSKTYPGKLTQLLFERFNYFEGDDSKAVTILPCELISFNADELKKCITKYIKHWYLGKEFQEWIENACSFHNTLVDRIVTGFPKDNIHEHWAKIGFDDKLIVTAEHYYIWVIEKNENNLLEEIFSNSGLNIQLVDDIQPYRTRKVRILNGAHTSMVLVGLLAGKSTVRETVETPFTNEFVKKLIFEEVTNVLDFPKEEITNYANDIILRFKNKAIIHNLSSIALNSISKFKVRVLPSIIDYYSINNKLPVNLTFAFAALICFYKGEIRGIKMPLNDSTENIELFKKYWKNSDTNSMVQQILENKSLWKKNLSKIYGLKDFLAKNIENIINKGIENAWNEVMSLKN